MKARRRSGPVARLLGALLPGAAMAVAVSAAATAAAAPVAAATVAVATAAAAPADVAFTPATSAAPATAVAASADEARVDERRREGWGPVSLPFSEQRDLRSQATGRTYRIFVSQPPGEAPPDGFPVVYVLDGNAYFPALSLQAHALGQRPDPSLREAVLVVGIGYPADALVDIPTRAEDYTPPAPDAAQSGDRLASRHGGAERFLDFIEHELKPRIAARYRVDPARQTLFGHSYGGLFTLYTLFTRPQAFQAYVAASPSIWWNRGYLLGLVPRLARATYPPVRLLLSVGGAEQPAPGAPLATPRDRHLAERRMVDNARELAAALAGMPGLQVRLHIEPDADHAANGLLTAPRVLDFARQPGAPR